MQEIRFVHSSPHAWPLKKAKSSISSLTDLEPIRHASASTQASRIILGQPPWRVYSWGADGWRAAFRTARASPEIVIARERERGLEILDRRDWR
jgi:hypothetical protein